MSEQIERLRKALYDAAYGGFTGYSSHHARRLKVFNKTGGYCWHCKNPLGFDWHADHLIPRAAGGSNKMENMVPSCRQCNLEKADLVDWEKNPVGFAQGNPA